MKATQQGNFPARLPVLASVALLVLAGALVFGANTVLPAQTVELQFVPSNAVPLVGTFYSIQLSNVPPLPFNPFPQLDVYSLSDAPGRYWVDDLAVDYVAMREQAEMESALRDLESQSGLNSLRGPPPIPGGGGGGGGVGGGGYPYYALTTNDLWLEVAGTTNAMTSNGTAYLVIHTPWSEPEGVYDVFATTNLAPSAWQWVMRTTAGQTNVTATGLAGPNEFFILGTMWTTNYVSGLTVAYEHLVGSTLSSDGYGTPNAWYLQNDINPRTSGVGSQDPNQDGLANWQEYLWGTDPRAAQGLSVWVSSPSGYSGTP